jgi:hypothetical protein
MIDSINISLLKQWLECPTKAYYQSIINRVLPTKPKALDLGTMWHQAMWARSNNMDVKKVLGTLDIPAETWTEWDNTLARALPLVEFMDGEEELAAEKGLSIPNFIKGLPLVGTLDNIVKWNGKIWHRQYKTLGGTTPVAVFAELQRTDWHECGYHKMLQLEYPEETIGGTILYSVRKLSPKQFKENPAGCIVEPLIMTRSQEIVEGALDDMYEVAENILNNIGDAKMPLRYPSSCGGPFRNLMCSYREVCYGNKKISSNDFISVEPRYVITQAE